MGTTPSVESATYGLMSIAELEGYEYVGGVTILDEDETMVHACCPVVYRGVPYTLLVTDTGTRRTFLHLDDQGISSLRSAYGTADLISRTL